MSACPRCGATLAPNARECPLCGLSLADPFVPEDAPADPLASAAASPAVPASSAPPLPGSPLPFRTAEPRQPPSSTAASWVTGLLLISAVVGVACILANLNDARYVSRIKHAVETRDATLLFANRAGAIAADDRVNLANRVALIVLIATAIAWIVWQYQAHRSLRSLSTTGSVRFSPSDAAVWWIVPVANFWMPFRVNRELQDGSARLLAKPSRAARTATWWACYLGAGLLAAAGSTLGHAATTDAQDRGAALSLFDRLLVSQGLAVAGRVLFVIAAFLAIGLVGAATRDLTSAYVRAPSSPGD